MINFNFLKDAGNYDQRKIGRTEVNGLTVSTAYTSDEGYETALIDKNGIHPIERYSSRSKAEIGHKEWEEKAQNITTVTKLGAWDGLVEDKKITIARNQ